VGSWPQLIPNWPSPSLPGQPIGPTVCPAYYPALDLAHKPAPPLEALLQASALLKTSPLFSKRPCLPPAPALASRVTSPGTGTFSVIGISRGAGAHEGSGGGHYGHGCGGGCDDDASAGVVQESTCSGCAHFPVLGRARCGGKVHENGPGGWGWVHNGGVGVGVVAAAAVAVLVVVVVVV
jgi:hypothetical protein